MPFSNVEISKEMRRPVELILFEIGSTRYAYNNGETTIVSDSITYLPVEGLQRSRILASDDSKSAVKIIVPHDNQFARIHSGVIPSGVASVTCRQYHVGDFDPIILFSGFVSTITFPRIDSRFIAEIVCRPSGRRGNSSVPFNKYPKKCGTYFTSDRCGISKASVEQSGEIIGIDGREITTQGLTDVGVGSIHWIAGTVESSEESRTIMGQTENVFILDLPFRSASVGATYTFTPGCRNRLAEDCRDRWNNLVNAQAWPGIPQKDPHRTRID